MKHALQPFSSSTFVDESLSRPLIDAFSELFVHPSSAESGIRCVMTVITSGEMEASSTEQVQSLPKRSDKIVHLAGEFLVLLNQSFEYIQEECEESGQGERNSHVNFETRRDDMEYNDRDELYKEEFVAEGCTW